MARQPFSKYFPTRYGGNLVLDQAEVNADDPAAPAVGERQGPSFVDVQLTNAQILALNATPINIIAAPGAGRAIVVDRLYLRLEAGTAYTEVGGQDTVLEYADGVDILTIDGTGFFTDAGVQRRVFEAGTLADAIAGLTPSVNSAVRLFKTTAELGGGAAARNLSVRAFYHIVDTGAFE